jgi:hypothetical protein
MGVRDVEALEPYISCQIINDKGKVVSIIMEDNNTLDCYTRPMANVPYISTETIGSVLDRYARTHDDRRHIRVKDVKGCVTVLL